MTIFEKNPIFRLWPHALLVPPNTRISVTRGKNRLDSSWLLENPYVKISLQITPISSGVISGSIWGVTEDEPVYKEGVAMMGRFKAEFKNRRLGDPQMPLYRTWVNNFESALDSLDWDTIQLQMDKQAIRQTALIATQHSH